VIIRQRGFSAEFYSRTPGSTVAVKSITTGSSAQTSRGIEISRGMIKAPARKFELWFTFSTCVALLVAAQILVISLALIGPNPSENSEPAWTSPWPGVVLCGLTGLAIAYLLSQLFDQFRLFVLRKQRP
jgi:drug/metabolite transporter (DMT)-like permease